jgi:hypothetical protein|tara:strand:- start:86 stop:442 length:357 start_codon:yes stop_codon:yes gene_type:complete
VVEEEGALTLLVLVMVEVVLLGDLVTVVVLVEMVVVLQHMPQEVEAEILVQVVMQVEVMETTVELEVLERHIPFQEALLLILVVVVEVRGMTMEPQVPVAPVVVELGQKMVMLPRLER